MRTGKLMIWANQCYFIPLASSEVNFIADASGIVFMLFLFSKVIINISNLNQKKKNSQFTNNNHVFVAVVVV